MADIEEITEKSDRVEEYLRNKLMKRQNFEKNNLKFLIMSINTNILF